MKKVISMVGTSLFDNYLQSNENDLTFKNFESVLSDKSADEYESEENRIKYLKTRLNEWIGKNRESKYINNLCAEIKSVSKIYEELHEDLDLYFFTSDTILSRIVFEIISENWQSFNTISNFKLSPNNSLDAVIKGLQVKNRDEFVRTGMVNLLNRIFRISNDFWDNIIINITAGYKATIPYLTVLGQINKCPIYYIFEDTDALVKIPNIPLNIDWNIFRENEDWFFNLESNSVIQLKEDTNFGNLESLVERVDNLVSLNPLGFVLWEKYKSSFYILKISQDVHDYIEKNKDRLSVIEKSFVELKRRLSEDPSNPDLNHGISNLNLPDDFRIFKHKEQDLQVRVLYKKENYKTKYGTSTFRIYIGLIAIGKEVHNVESEYIDYFKNNSHKEMNLDNYINYRISKEETK